MLLGVILLGEGNAQTLPIRGPLVSKVPAFAQWTVLYRYAGEAAPGRSSGKEPNLGPRLRRERVAKTKDLLRAVWEYDGAPKEECWLIGGVQWSIGSPTEPPIAATNEENPYFRNDLPVHNFPGFEWINSSLFVGVENISGKECFVFKKADPVTGVIVAYVETQSLLPVCLKYPDSIRTYLFESAPDTMLAIPQKITEAIADENERTAKAMAPGAR